MKKLTYAIFTCLLALTCIFSAGCNVTFKSSTLPPTESRDFKNAFYPKGVGVDFKNLEQLTEAVQNGNEEGGYFVALDFCYYNNYVDEIFRFNVNTNSKIKYGNSITQRGYYYDSQFHEEDDLSFYTIKYVYICYEMQNAPQNLSFEHCDYDAGIEEAELYEGYYEIFTKYNKIINVLDPNGKVVAKFAYAVNDKCKTISNEYFEQLITNRASIIKGGILPHTDDVNKPYLFGGYELTDSCELEEPYGYYDLMEQEVQEVVNQNNSCFSTIKITENSGYYENSYFGYHDLCGFYFKDGISESKILRVDSILIDSILVNEDGKVSTKIMDLMFYSYVSYELKTIPTKLRFEHYFNQYGNYERLILVYDQNNNLVLEFAYDYTPQISHLFLSTGAHSGDQKIEEFLTKYLIFVKGE